MFNRKYFIIQALEDNRLPNNKFKFINKRWQCWANNQYSRRECLEIFGIPENIENKDLENLTLQIFGKIYISVDRGDVDVE